MELKDSHAVPPGKSLIERIQDLATERYHDYIANEDESNFVGVCEALSILRSTDLAVEINECVARHGTRYGGGFADPH
jgi:hypothetical protein